MTGLWAGLARLTLAVTAAAMLAGCMANFYDTPRPFEGKNRNDPMLDSILSGASLEVRPVEGLPAAEAVALSRAISEIAHDHDIAAVTDEGARIADRLTGKAEITTAAAVTDLPPRLALAGRKGRPVPAADAPEGRIVLEPAGNTQVRFSWTLTGADGAVKDTVDFAVPISGTLPAFDKRERQRIAERTVAWLRASLDREASSPAQADARQAKPVILVSPVEGATGDGRVSLTTALAEMLAASGRCDVLAKSEQARIPKGRTAYRVRGRVQLSDGGPGRQIVDIAWTLTDVVGREIGTVNQKNPVPRGSLDGAWGQTAYDAALGASDGLLALIERSPVPAAVE